MRYAVTVDVAASRERLAALLDDPMTWPEWQESLLRVEPLEGVPGLAGSRTRLVYASLVGDLEVVETVVVNELPERLVTTAATRGTFAEVRHELEALGAGATRWTQRVRYSLTGPGIAVFGTIVPGTLPRRTRRQMLGLKYLAERPGGGECAPPPLYY